MAHLFLMAHSIRGRVKSDTAAMKRVLALRGEKAGEDEIRKLRYWLKGRTLAQFARAAAFKYTFVPQTDFNSAHGIRPKFSLSAYPAG